jgi:quinone-modifying oxidoreductase subunit QmoA
MVSSLADGAPSGPVALDRDGFVIDAPGSEGIFAAGCAKGPYDVATSVQDATAAAALAIETIQMTGRTPTPALPARGRG